MNPFSRFISTLTILVLKVALHSMPVEDELVFLMPRLMQSKLRRNNSMLSISIVEKRVPSIQLPDKRTADEIALDDFREKYETDLRQAEIKMTN